jgi:hypothetical protein
VGRPDFKFVMGLDAQWGLVSLCVDFQCFAAYLHAGPYRPVTSNFLVFGSKVGSRSRAGGYRGVSDFLNGLSS